MTQTRGLARPSGDSSGDPLSAKPKALLAGQRRVQKAGPGVAWGCLTAWGFPPFPGRPLRLLFFPLRFQQGGHRVQDGHGARHGSQALGEAQILRDNRRDIKTDGSEVFGADDGAVTATVPAGRRPRTKRSPAAARPRPLGKRKSNFPDSAVLPQRMGTAAASGLGPRAGHPHPEHGLALPAPSPADSVSAASSLAARKCQTAAPTLESTRLLEVLLLPAVFP